MELEILKIAGLVASGGLLLSSTFDYLKLKKIKDLFNLTDSPRNFDLDYLDALEHLPKEKNICIRGYLEELDGATYLRPEQSFEEIQEDGILSEVKLPPQSNISYLKDDEGKFFIGLILKNPIWFHNVTKLSREALKKEDKLEGEYLEKVKGGSDLVRYGLKPGRSYNFIGKISKYKGEFINKRGVEYFVEASLVSGEMKDLALKHLDSVGKKLDMKFKSKVGISCAVSFGTIALRKILETVRD